MKLMWTLLIFLLQAQISTADSTCGHSPDGMFQLTGVDFTAAAKGSYEDLKTIEACGAYMYVISGREGRPTFHPYFEAWFQTNYDFPRYASSSTDERSSLECNNGMWLAGFLSYKDPRHCYYTKTVNIVRQAVNESDRVNSIIVEMMSTLAAVNSMTDGQIRDFCIKLNGDKYRTPKATSNLKQACRESTPAADRAGLSDLLQTAISQLEIQKTGAFDSRQVFGAYATYNRSDERIYSRCGGTERAPWGGYYPSANYYTSLANLSRSERCVGQDFTSAECIVFGRVYAAEVIAYHAFEPCNN